MSDKSKIEWTDATWNPIRGCTRVSPGCGGPGPHGGCYAEAVAARFSQPAQGDKPAGPYHGLAEIRGGKPRWTGKLSFGHDLEKPLSWRRPRRIFVNSMSDLFHEELTAEEIATVYAVCVAAHHLRGHTFQILTKRSTRMRAILNDPAFWDQVNAEADAMVMERTDPLARRSDDARATLRDYDPETPPPGIWLGVSVEDQERADERIPDLMATPAAVRWISAEPLLRWLDLARIAVRAPGEPAGFHHYLNALTGEIYDDENGTIEEAFGEAQPPRLDWVVVGGESGPRARPMHPDWARVLREQCATANTPFLFKQWGEYNTSSYDMITGNPVYRQFVDFNHWVNKASTWVNGGTCIDRNGRILTNGADFMRARDEGTFPVTIMHRVGKKTAGRQLDGVTHDAFPTEPGALSRNSATAGPPALFTA